MSVAINATNFPDYEFRRQVSFMFDKDRDGVLSDTEIENAKILELSHINLGGQKPDDAIESLSGIEYLTGLEKIDLFNMQKITSVNLSTLSNLISLRVIDCFGVTSFDVTHNPLLKSLDIRNQKISSIDLSQNPDLESFKAGWYSGGDVDSSERIFLSSLDISHNTKLKILDLDSIDSPNDFRISSITFGNVRTIEYLDLTNANINSLDMSLFPNLKNLDISRTPITTIDLSECSELEFFRCYDRFDNPIGEIQSINLYGLKKLKKVEITNCLYLTSLNVQNCSAMWFLKCSQCHTIASIDLNGCTALAYFSVFDDRALAAIPNLSGKQNLIKVDAAQCYALTAFNISNCPKLEYCLIGSIQSNVLYNFTQDAKLHVLSFWQCSSTSEIRIIGCLRLLDLIANSDPTLGGIVTSPETRQTCIYERTNPIYADDPNPFEEYSDSSASLSGTLKIEPAHEYFSYNKYAELIDGNIRITQQPENQNAIEGANATFTIAADGELLSYQWEEKTEDGYWTEIENATSTSYTHEAFLVDNLKKYRCKVRNISNVFVYSNEVTLTVIAGPNIVIHPASASVVDGTKHTFSIIATGNDLTYQWQSSTNNGSTWNDIRYATSRTYEVQTSLGMTGTQYRCVVTNSVGSATSNAATLTVTVDQSLAPPEVSIHPVDVNVNEGGTATFSAAATGEELSYQWQTLKNGQWTTITGATGTSYSVAGSRLLNGAKYRCQISNASGSVYTDAATLFVTLAPTVTTPVITVQPRSVTVQAGNSAAFTCRATGGDLSYQWQVKQGGSWYDITGETNTVYSFQVNQNDNGKQVRCIVENSAGSIYSNVATLTVPGSAPLTFYGYHSIIISGKNTYGEWGMYPTSRPHIAPPEVKTSYVDVPGADGGLDYTDLLTGQAQYGYRKGSWEFLLIPGVRWADVYRSLCSYLHGKVHTIVLEDDPTWEYTGRLSVNEWKSAAHNSLITIDYILDPNPVNTDGETYDGDEADLQAAARVLRKSGNEGCVIKLIDGAATVIEETNLFPDGDIIAY